LLCRSLALRIRDWDGRAFDRRAFFFEDAGYTPERLLVARRLGIPAGRDEHLLYRYLDEAHAASATEDPRRKRTSREGRDWRTLSAGASDPNAGGPTVTNN
jgi:DNA-3-methyladenine glycosylase